MKRSCSDNPTTIFHITHWKAGSQWIRKILEMCMPECIVAPEIDEIQFLEKPTIPGMIYPTVYVTREQFQSVHLPENARWFVVIRDLRDTLVSVYYSLKYSHPVIDDRISRRRERLCTINEEEGLLYLIDDWLELAAAIQRSWLGYDLVLRYEDLLVQDVALLEQTLIDQCGMNISRERLREAIKSHRFAKITGRAPGVEDRMAHERKGVAGDWRLHFTARVVERFKECYGDLLIATGYEQDMSWDVESRGVNPSRFWNGVDETARLAVIERQGAELGRIPQLEADIAYLKQQLAASEADRAARLAVIERQGAELGRIPQLEADIAYLKQQLAASEADRAARLEVIERHRADIARLTRQLAASEMVIEKLRRIPGLEAVITYLRKRAGMSKSTEDLHW